MSTTNDIDAAVIEKTKAETETIRAQGRLNDALAQEAAARAAHLTKGAAQ